MPTIITAGDAVSAASSFAAGNDGLLNIVVGPAGGKVTALSFDATGKPLFNTANDFVFTRYYASAAQAVVANASISLAHGLPGKPRRVKVVLRCKTADIGFAVGDEIDYSTGFSIAAAQIVRIQQNATTVKINHAGNITESRGDTSTTQAAITAASWEWFVEAWF